MSGRLAAFPAQVDLFFMYGMRVFEFENGVRRAYSDKATRSFSFQIIFPCLDLWIPTPCKIITAGDGRQCFMSWLYHIKLRTVFLWTAVFLLRISHRQTGVVGSHAMQDHSS